MADPRNVIVEIKNGLADVRQQMNLLKQETQGWVSTLGTGLSKMQASGGGGGGGNVSSNQVAPNPKFTPPATPATSNVASGSSGGSSRGGGGGGGNGGGGGGSDYTGNTSLTRYVTENAAAGFLYTAGITSGMVDKPGESVEAQLLMSRVGYFNMSSRNRTEADTAYKSIQTTQAALAFQATTKDKMDVMRGLAAAQSIGVTGGNITQASAGMASVAGGVANVSNLLPGAGFEGTMRAYGSMQQGRNVNMLRGIGIRLRDESGNMKPPDQIIDDIWKKICRDYAGAYGAGKTPSEQEVLIGLQPGNSMDSMLDMYFGNDPMAKQLVANGLLYKAKTKGAAINKATLTSMGATTEAVNAQSYRNAAGAKQTGLTAEAGAAGYATVAKQLGDFSLMMTEKYLPEMKYVTETNARIMTFLGAANDTGVKALGLLGMTSGGRAVALAAGAAVATQFLPNTVEMPGTGGNTTSSATGTVGGNPRDFAVALLNKLGAPITEENISAMMIWQKREGGAWKNSASYNPLNTSLQLDGSVNYKSKEKAKGVQAYQSWAQGVDATYQTLTGANAKTYGYDKVVALLRAGAPKEEVFAALSQSSWDANRYKGTDWSAITPIYNVGTTPTTGPGPTNTINYGGVTFKVYSNDPKAIAREIQKHFDELKAKNAMANK